MDAEVLKSYLIKLGVQVDTAAFDKMKRLLGDLEKAMGKNASSMGLQMVKGAGLAVGALAMIDTAIVKTVKAIADADMQYQLLGQRMFMSTDAAKAFKQATDTLGKSLEDIAWNKELKDRYVDLVQQVNQLKLPKESAEMFKGVRDIGFQFDRLKLASTQALEHMAYNLVRINKGEMFDFRTQLSSWVDDFIKKVPEYGRKLAEWLQPFIKVTKSAGKAIMQLWEFIQPGIDKLKELWDKLDGIQKMGAVLAVTLIPLFLIGSPWLLGLAAIGAALLLIDDYMHFKEGKKSLPQLIALWATLRAVVASVHFYLGNIVIALDHMYHFFSGKAHPSGMSWFQHTKMFSKARLKEIKEGLFDAKEKLTEAAERENAPALREGKEKVKWEKQYIKTIQVVEKGRTPSQKEIDTAYKEAVKHGRVAPEVIGKDETPVEAKGETAKRGRDTSSSAVSAPAHSGLTQSEKKFLTQISKGEGTSEEEARKHGYATGYDVTLGYGRYAKEEKPVSEMTFRELKEHQNKMLAKQRSLGLGKDSSSAAGKYQFVRDTLFGKKGQQGLLKQEGISENEVFSPEMQDRLALALIKDATKKFKTGRMSAAEYHNIVSGQWASVTKYGASGGSYRGQRAPTTTADLAPIFQSLKREPVRPPTFAKTKQSGSEFASLQNSPPPGAMPINTEGAAATAPVYNVTSVINAQTNDPAELARLAAIENKKMLVAREQEKGIKRRQG